MYTRSKSINLKSGFVVAAAVCAICAPGIARADVMLEFNYLVTGDQPSGTAWATLDIVDSAIDEVTMTLSHNATSAQPQFISEVWLNLTSVPGDLAADYSSPVMDAQWGEDFNNNAGYQWDVWIDLLTAPPEDRLNVGDTVTWTMTGTGLDSLDFWTTATNDLTGPDLYGMVHVQGIAGGNSGKIAAVPEPTSIAALSIGALALLRRRKQN